MTIDLEMAEIINVFFQESDEGLDAMESGLLSLEGGSDCEAINTIFRAAHSIKGGAGTFGFGEISKFTHAVETLLDQMRNGTRGVSAETVQVLLQAVDAMREMVALARARDAGAARRGGRGRDPTHRNTRGPGRSRDHPGIAARRGAHGHCGARGRCDPGDDPGRRLARPFRPTRWCGPPPQAGRHIGASVSYHTRACSRPATTRCACSRSSHRSAG